MVIAQTKHAVLSSSIIGGLLLLLAWCFSRIVLHAPIADEVFHLDQIQRFARSEISLNPSLTQIPGYHALVAIASQLTGRYSLVAFRFFSFLLNASVVPAFFIVAKAMDPVGAVTRTLQFSLLPILFPLFFLLYTDIASVLFILLALHSVLCRRPVVAALFATISILMRQNNMVWVLLLWSFLFLLGGYVYDISVQRKERDALSTITIEWAWIKGAVQRWMIDTWPFLIIIILFAAFVIFNGGVALGDVTSHPFPAFHLGNIYFFLFLFFFFFLPMHIANVPRIFTFFRSHKILILSSIVLFGYFFLQTFVNDHPNNQVQYAYFLRNQLLAIFTESNSWKLLFFLPVLASILSLFVTRLTHPIAYLIYPVSFIFLTPSWLIEQRYYLIPISLFLLYRERKKPIVEWGMVVFWAAGSLYLFEGIVRGQYFL